MRVYHSNLVIHVFNIHFFVYLESTCFENGVHYDVGESYKNGSFKLICKENGIAIAGESLD